MSDKTPNKLICIFGLGQSGVSAARYLQRTEQDFFVVDTRDNPPGKDEIKSLNHCRQTYFGTVPQENLNQLSMIIVSPGISKDITALALARSSGVEVIGDVELFVRNTNKKIVAITGSNGKSTVTDLTHKLLVAAGINAVIGGNYGIAVLDYLPENSAELYVLELSSFQLDTTPSIAADVAVILNISEDHMDRYESFEDYRQSKLSLTKRAKSLVINADDPNIEVDSREKIIKFSMKQASSASYSTCIENSKCHLLVNGQAFISADQLQISGIHNWSNVLVALAVFELLNLKLNNNVVEALKNYQGLPHRFQLIESTDNTDWINDSKATNVGATQAALNSIDKALYSRIILIAGGDAKDSDLQPLKAPLSQIDYLIVMGKDANQFKSLISLDKYCLVDSMQSAVNKAKEVISFYHNSSQENRAIVLLSPACSSLDMYKNFEARGQAFIDAIKECA
jgi:UDP-N-acetylmuramoylalanine--D-glutamate ligase